MKTALRKAVCKYGSGLLLGLPALAGPALAADAPEPPHAQPLQPIPSLDLPRYMGRWHEIARFPNWFQKDCAGDSSADYQLNADGTVQVLNRCRLANGEFKEALGQARRVEQIAAAG